MPKWLKYYKYKLKESFLTVMLGTEKQQIIETLEHYRNKGQDIYLPKLEEIHEAPSLDIRCGLPFISNKFFFKAQIRDGITLDINANAVDYVKDIADNYQKLKKGGLYKFEPGLSEFGLYYLPEYVMLGLKEYNWDQHNDLVEKWNHVFDDARENSPIIRSEDIKEKDPNKIN